MKNFQLIETMLWKGEFPYLIYHRERMRDSAQYFSFSFSEEKFEKKLFAATSSFSKEDRYKVRVLLFEDGNMRIEHDLLPENALKTDPYYVRISPHRVDSTDPFLYHKTTRRELYNQTFLQCRKEGLADMIFMNQKGQITEGAVNNVYLEINSQLYTSPVSCGLLNGVYRQSLSVAGKIKEKILTQLDIRKADILYISNAVHGMRQVELCD